ncbi:MAG: hypothetical protein ED559_08950 [Phycisphaera sp.]|nr:MAG: hypothetical protein ED559_08950 [Phycisphaera sp.]
MALASCGKSGGEGERQGWESAKKSDSLAGYELFTSTYPGSIHAPEAEAHARGIRRDRLVCPDVVIAWKMPGWTASELERELEDEIDAAFASLPVLGYYSTKFRAGSIEIDLSIGQPDFTRPDLESVEDAVASLREVLPGNPEIFTSIHREALWSHLLIVLHGDIAAQELSAHASTLESRLAGIGAVTEVFGAAEPEPRVEILLDDNRCRMFGVSAIDVVDSLEVFEAPVSIDMVGETVVSKQPGQEVRIRDLARVGDVESHGTRCTFDGSPAVALCLWPDRNRQGETEAELRQILDEYGAGSNLSIDYTVSSMTSGVRLSFQPGSSDSESLDTARVVAERLGGSETTPVLVEVVNESPLMVQLTAFGQIDPMSMFSDNYAIPGVSMHTVRRPLPEERGATLAVAVAGQDWEQIAAVRSDLIQQCSALAGVVATSSDELFTVPEVSLVIDKERLAQRGVSAQEVAAELAAMTGEGIVALDGKVVIRTESSARYQEPDEFFKMLRQDGVEVELVDRWVALRHFNGERAAVVELVVSDSSMVDAVRAELQAVLAGISAQGIRITCLSE